MQMKSKMVPSVSLLHRDCLKRVPGYQEGPETSVIKFLLTEETTHTQHKRYTFTIKTITCVYAISIHVLFFLFVFIAGGKQETCSMSLESFAFLI